MLTFDINEYLLLSGTDKKGGLEMVCGFVFLPLSPLLRARPEPLLLWLTTVFTMAFAETPLGLQLIPLLVGLTEPLFERLVGMG